MPVTFTFRGDQVATTSAIDDDGNGGSIITVDETPFLSTDLVMITFEDAAFDPISGEFVMNADIIYTGVQVIRDGVTYDLDVSPGSKIKESGGGSNKEQGDSFFQTNDSIGPAASGPFSSIPSDQYVFATTTTFTAGSNETISRVTTVDFNTDGDTVDPGEPGNSNFNQFFGENNAFVCFARGTLILTPKGYVPVESLCAGDLVETADCGALPISWIGSRFLPVVSDRVRPVTIRKDAFAPGVPFKDLQVSPQHRLLVRSAQAELLFGTNEVLSAAKFLTDGVNLVQRPQGFGGVEYYHFMFEAHQIVWANGAATESLFLGDVANGAIGAAAASEILDLFPELNTPQKGPCCNTARPTLRRHEARLVAA